VRPPISKFLEAAAFGAALAFTGSAAAQPCCAGASALTPARLSLHEDALVGVAMRSTFVLGSFDDHRHYVPAAPGAHEVDLEEDLIATLRLFSKAQVSVTLPIDETYRATNGRSEWGGGFGDAQLGARYDFLEAGMSRSIPGIAVLGAVTLPTGRAVEDASQPQATDATGTGAGQVALGAAVEQTFGSVYLAAIASVTWRGPRTVGDLHEQDGLVFVGSLASAYTFKSGPVLALSAVYTAELAAILDDKRVQNGARGTVRLAFSGGYPFSDKLRAQLAFFGDLPITGLGQNDPTGIGASFILLRSWS
jgi:hypothetical protein